MINQVLDSMNADCSSLAWSTEDGKHLWGRNFDFDHIAQGSMVTYLPRGKEYYGYGTSMENNLLKESRFTSVYAVVGLGA